MISIEEQDILASESPQGVNPIALGNPLGAAPSLTQRAIESLSQVKQRTKTTKGAKSTKEGKEESNTRSGKPSQFVLAINAP